VTTKRPRFIAGAVCPACGAADRTVVEHAGDARVRRCVACGFTEREAVHASSVPRGRLDRPSAGVEPTPTPVRWVDPKHSGENDPKPRERSD